MRTYIMPSEDFSLREGCESLGDDMLLSAFPDGVKSAGDLDRVYWRDLERCGA